jgi:hypothetical protein
LARPADNSALTAVVRVVVPVIAAAIAAPKILLANPIAGSTGVAIDHEIAANPVAARFIAGAGESASAAITGIAPEIGAKSAAIAQSSIADATTT